MIDVDVKEDIESYSNELTKAVRKSIFALINYYRFCGFNYEDINDEKKMMKKAKLLSFKLKDLDESDIYLRELILSCLGVSDINPKDSKKHDMKNKEDFEKFYTAFSEMDQIKAINAQMLIMTMTIFEGFIYKVFYFLERFNTRNETIIENDLHKKIHDFTFGNVSDNLKRLDENYSLEILKDAKPDLLRSYNMVKVLRHLFVHKDGLIDQYNINLGYFPQKMLNKEVPLTIKMVAETLLRYIRLIRWIHFQIMINFFKFDESEVPKIFPDIL